jgi:hypothetical protein
LFFPHLPSASNSRFVRQIRREIKFCVAGGIIFPRTMAFSSAWSVATTAVQPAANGEAGLHRQVLLRDLSEQATRTAPWRLVLSGLSLQVDAAALEPLVRAVVAEAIAALKRDRQEELRRLAGEPAVEPLLMKPGEAAKLLQIGERLLWELSVKRREIPFIRLGTAIRYSVESLRAHIAANQEPAAPADSASRPRRSKRTPASGETESGHTNGRQVE